jgi:hypothetical protein
MLLKILSGYFKKSVIVFCLVLGVCSQSAHSTQLSASLTDPEVGKISRILGFGPVHRAWTAHGQPTTGLGLDLGVETTFLFRRDMLDFGDRAAVLPRIIPVPRIWFSWELPAHFMISGSFAPGMLFGGVTAVGMGGQWKFFEKPEIATNVSLGVTYSILGAFDGYRGHSQGVHLQVARDLIFWQPYAGAGLMFNQSRINQSLVQAGVDRSRFLAASHVFFGARVDLIAKIAFQLDLTNDLVHLSVLFATSF